MRKNTNDFEILSDEEYTESLRREIVWRYLSWGGELSEKDIKFCLKAFDEEPEAREILNKKLTSKLAFDGKPFLKLNLKELCDMNGRFMAHAFAREMQNPRPNPEWEKIEELMDVCREEVKKEMEGAPSDGKAFFLDQMFGGRTHD